jgi:hypothetical protein
MLFERRTMEVALSRIYAAPISRLGCLAIECQGGFSLPMLNAFCSGCTSARCSRTHQLGLRLGRGRLCGLCVRSSVTRKSSPARNCPRRSRKGSSNR